MSAIPTIWFPLKLLWTHRTHLGNYASCNAGLTCQRTAQGQPGDWPSCDKSALTSSKLIWPGADCWQLIILAILSSRQVQGRWRRRMSGVRKGEEDVGKGKKWIFNFIPPIFLLVFFCWTCDELWYFIFIYFSRRFSLHCSPLFGQWHFQAVFTLCPLGFFGYDVRHWQRGQIANFHVLFLGVYSHIKGTVQSIRCCRTHPQIKAHSL